MSDRIRDLLFIVFFVYILASQHIINGYDNDISDLLKTNSGLMKVCISGAASDLNKPYDLKSNNE